MRFILLRDRQSEAHPDGRSGLWAVEEQQMLKHAVVRPLLFRLEYLQAALNRVQDEKAQWAMTRMGVVEMVVQRLDEMIPDVPNPEASDGKPTAADPARAAADCPAPAATAAPAPDRA